MAARQLAVPLVALVLAALDTLSTRLAHAELGRDPRLFAESALLWGAFALLASVPAALWEHLRRGARGRDERARHARAAVELLAWTALPVVVHTCLDPYIRSHGFLSGAWPIGASRAALFVVLGVLCAPLLARLLAGAPPRAAGLAVAALSLFVGLALPFRVERAAERPAPPARPNVLLLVWDTTRAASLDLYGGALASAPGLAELAEGALVFEEARSASAFTLSAHASLLTGVAPSRHRATRARMLLEPERGPTVAELLRDAGYRTGAFVGTSVLRADTGLGRGFDAYDDRVDPPVCDTRAWALVHDAQSLIARLAPSRFGGNGNPHGWQDFQRPAGEVLGRALAWIRRPDPRPWFCLVNLYDAHWPHLPGDEARARLVSPYDGSFDGYLFRSARYDASRDGALRGSQLGERDRRHAHELYCAEISELDGETTRFLAELDLERTAVVLTADHGEAFGEGGRWGHEYVLEPQVRVPLVVRPPGAAGSSCAPGITRVPGKVAGIDVVPTLLALAGLDAPPHMPGLDLTREAPAPERVVVVEHLDEHLPALRRVALYSGEWKLVRSGTGGAATFALFDLATDPIGTRDVAAEHPDVLRSLIATLAELEPAPAASEPEPAPGDGTRDDLHALGYGRGER